MLFLKREKRINLNTKTIKKEKDLFDNKPSLMSLIIPDALEEKRDYLYLAENRYVRTFVLTAYPNGIYLGWLDTLFNQLGDININVISEPASEGNVIRRLSYEITKLQSEYYTYQSQGNINNLYQLEESIAGYEKMRREIQMKGDKLFFVTILLRLNAESIEDLNYRTKILKEEFEQDSSKVRTLTFNQLEGLKSTLPISSNNIKGYERNMTADRLIKDV